METHTCSQIRRLNVLKVTILPKLIYRSNTIPIKISEECFVDKYKLVPNSYGKAKELKQPK